MVWMDKVMLASLRDMLGEMSIGTFLLITTGISVVVAILLAVRRVKKIQDKQEQEERERLEEERKKKKK